MTASLRHLLICYHTCPTEQPGQDLAGGMNVLLRGFLRHTTWPTDVVTRGFGLEPEKVSLSSSATLHRLPCGAGRPWTRERAWECLPGFRQSLKAWLDGRRFQVASAHYWMSGTLLDLLECPSGIVFHTLQAQKGPPSSELERLRLEAEGRLIERYRCGFLHWHDLRNAASHYPFLRAGVLRPGCDLELAPTRAAGIARRFGWAARADGIKNFERALVELRARRRLEPESVLAVAGWEGQNEPGISYLGSLSPEQMVGFHDQIDELWNFSHYETFGLSLLEALTRGATVGLSETSDWARRLRRIGIDPRPGALWSQSQRSRALRLAQSYQWLKALTRWERWLRSLTARE